MAYTSVIGMNCSADFQLNFGAVQEATCLAYDAVLGLFGAPRLNCTNPTIAHPPQVVNCTWSRQDNNHSAFLLETNLADTETAVII